MSNKENGGPAFPVKGIMYGGQLGGQLDHGMTLRDYFAAKAMQGFCTQPSDEFDDLRRVAEQSYNLADAMLQEREK